MINRALMAGWMLAAVSLGASALEGDASAGEQKAAQCAACHGADGNSGAPSFPKLAGQGVAYTVKQLEDIQSGAREVPEMIGQLDGMDEQDFADMAAWYESQTSSIERADPELVELGEKIWRGGIADRGVPACSACHGPAGQGMAPAAFPKLGGQHADYTAKQLRDFRAAADQRDGRMNDGDDKRTMRMIAATMSDREIEAVASFAAGLYRN